MENCMNDYELLYMYHQLEDVALHLLMQKYSSKVWFHIYQLTSLKSLHSREELYQLCMIKLLDAIDSYQIGKYGSFSTYYLKIVKHVIIDYVKKQNRYQSHLDEFTMLYGFEACDESGHYLKEANAEKSRMLLAKPQNEIRRLLKESNIQLSDKDYQIVYMRMQGYSYKEIAEKMHVPRNTIDYMVRKLRKQKDGID